MNMLYDLKEGGKWRHCFKSIEILSQIHDILRFQLAQPFKALSSPSLALSPKYKYFYQKPEHYKTCWDSQTKNYLIKNKIRQFLLINNLLGAYGGHQL